MSIKEQISIALDEVRASSTGTLPLGRRLSIWQEMNPALSADGRDPLRVLRSGDEMTRATFGIIVLVLLVCGCAESEPPVEKRNAWYEYGEGASANLRPGRLFHETQLRRHPKVGFATYTVAAHNWSRSEELSAIQKAVQRIRREFSESYRQHAISAWNSRDAKGVKVEPEEIVILVRDIGSGESAAPAIRVGYLFSAHNLFDETASVDAVIDGAFRDENPLHYDRSQTVPENEVVYDIVERFRKSNASTPGGP